MKAIHVHLNPVRGTATAAYGCHPFFMCIPIVLYSPTDSAMHKIVRLNFRLYLHRHAVKRLVLSDFLLFCRQITRTTGVIVVHDNIDEIASTCKSGKPLPLRDIVFHYHEPAWLEQFRSA